MKRICAGCECDFNKLALNKRKKDSDGTSWCKKCYNKQNSLRRKLQQSQTDLDESFIEEKVKELRKQLKDKTITHKKPKKSIKVPKPSGSPANCTSSEPGPSNPKDLSSSRGQSFDIPSEDFKIKQDEMSWTKIQEIKQSSSGVCRTCLLESSEMHSLYKVTEISQRNEELSLFLRELTNLECLIDDGLPIFICQDCIQSISNAISFKEMCLRSDYVLRGNNSENIEHVLLEEMQVDERQIIPEISNNENNTDIENIIVKEEMELDLQDIPTTHEDTTVQLTITDKDIEDPQQGSSKEYFSDISCSDGMPNDPNDDPLNLKAKVENNMYCLGCGTNLCYKARVKYLIDKSGTAWCKRCNKSEFVSFEKPVKKQWICLGCGKDMKSFRNSKRTSTGSTWCYKCYDRQRKIRSNLLKSSTIPPEDSAIDEQVLEILKEREKAKKQKTQYMCTICGKILTHSGSLKVHLTTHSEAKPFECSLCGKLFKAKAFIRKHMNTNHLPCAKHKCNICNKEYQSLSTLKAHIKGHDMPFLCTICGKRFSQSSGLKSHLESHSQERIFKCDFCEKSFNVKKYLRCHRLTHTSEKRFKCNACGKSFHQKGLLHNHAIIHTNLRPFICTFCDKTFNKRTHLNRHMYLHTGEKKYTCSICPVGYIQHQDFKRHMMKHKENGDIVEESLEVQKDNQENI